MSQLESVIEKAATAFALSIIAAVKGASLQKLLALEGGAAPIVTAAKRRGRPPKAKPGRKPGRPAKAAARVIAKTPGWKPTKKTAKAPTRKKRKINYPKCSVPGCGKNRYARGNGMCGKHFKASKAKK
jgi:hypothetical protein